MSILVLRQNPILFQLAVNMAYNYIIYTILLQIYEYY
jgi:hypothetical protein